MSLRLPDPLALREIITMIVGEDSPLQPTDRAGDFAAADTGTVYGALLRDDQGTIQGAVLADTAAAVHLGGSMIMIPPGAQQEQWRLGSAEEPVLDALAEVINMLRSVINNVSGNPHVAPDPLAPLPELAADQAWLASPAARVDLAGALPFATARLAVLSR